VVLLFIYLLFLNFALVYMEKGTLGSRFGSADSFGTVHHPVFNIKAQTQSSWRGIRPCLQKINPTTFLHYATYRSSFMSV